MKFDEAFRHFIRSNSTTAESVFDMLPKKVDFQNADYLFQRRKFIVELKGLEKEKYALIRNICFNLLNKREILPFQNGKTVGDILKEHPAKDDIMMTMHSKITASLVGALEKANRQIRETRHYFRLFDSRGVAVVVNLDNTALVPKLAEGVINRLMMQKKVDGLFRYEELATVIYISNVHFQPNGAMPFYVINRSGQFDEFDYKFIDEFRLIWGFFCSHPVDELQQASHNTLRECRFLSQQKNLKD